jgi:hypothetical protein
VLAGFLMMLIRLTSNSGSNDKNAIPLLNDPVTLLPDVSAAFPDFLAILAVPFPRPNFKF